MITEYKVLDQGFVRYIDHMGTDHDIVKAARLSYGKMDENRPIEEDRTLIRYMLSGAYEMKCPHSSPFEQCELKVHIKIPMDSWRQMIRHRTACLSGDTILQFDLPGGIERKGNQLTIEQIYNKFQPTKNQFRPDKENNKYYKRDRIQNMNLRCMNEELKIPCHTKIIDIWQSGNKEVYEVKLKDGSSRKMSKDHLCRTNLGWLKLENIFILPTKENSKWDYRSYPWPEFACIGSEAKYQKFEDPILDFENEKWLPCPFGWEEYYKVSSEGRIKRTVGGRGSRSLGRHKKLTLTEDEHYTVSLNRPNIQETFLVHNLVLTAFDGPCPYGLQCRHLDGNGKNNRNTNLKWGTSFENAQDRIDHQRTTALSIKWLNIDDIKYIGKEMTYDLETEIGNFSANGMIVHNSVNEYSTRYTEAIDDKQTTAPDEWRTQSKSNKQGSGDYLTEWYKGAEPHPDMDPGLYLSQREENYHNHAENLYKERLLFGVAKEQARKDLPLSTYTEAIWKIDLHNLMHFLKLRMDSHAQLEIRSYANAIAEITKELWPIAWEAFDDYILESITFSKQELNLLKLALFTDGTLLELPIDEYLSNKREQNAFRNKIEKIVKE